MSLSQAINGDCAVWATDNADPAVDIHAWDTGTIQGDPVEMTRLEALESQLVQVTQLLIKLSGSIGDICSHGLSPKEGQQWYI